MPKSIENIAKNVPFSVKEVMVAFLWSAGVWLLISIVATLLIRSTMEIDDKAYAKIFFAQPNVASLYALYYCASVGFVTWFFLLGRIDAGIKLFFDRKNLKTDIFYGMGLFLKSLGVLVLVLISIYIILAIISWLFKLDFELMLNTYLQGRDQEAKHIFETYRLNPLIIFLAVVFGPVYEEIFFRGCLFTALRKRFKMWKAIWISSLFFALIHGYIFNFLPVLVLGVFLAFAYEKRASLIAPLTLHFC